MKEIIIIGCGGHAKSICDSILSKMEYSVAGFVDRTMNGKFTYCDKYCIGCDEELPDIFRSGITNAAIGIGFLGNSNVRNILYNEIKKIGFHLPIIIDKSAIISCNAMVGEGTFIGKNVVVNTEVNIGKMAILNTGCLIDHECKIGDFSHVAVGACLCGSVTVGQNCLIGANSTIIQGCEVKNGSIVGAGNVINFNVEENKKVVNERIYRII